MKRLFTLALSSIFIVFGISPIAVAATDITKMVAGDYMSVSNYICNNLKSVTANYNETVRKKKEKKFLATSCEQMIPTKVISLDSDGIYLDFNGKNGYMVIIDNYTIVEFQTRGDLPYLKQEKSAIFSTSDGFVHEDLSGSLAPYKSRRALTKKEWDKKPAGKPKPYAGQKIGGEGDISAPDAYVKARYGSGYKLYRSKSLPSYTYTRQENLSIYYKLVGKNRDTQEGEGNCTLSAVYSLMNYLKTSGKYSKLPYAWMKTKYYASEDKFYIKYLLLTQYANKPKKSYKSWNTTKYFIDSPKYLPKLYLDARAYAIKDYGYEREGSNPFAIEGMIKSIAKKYGYSKTETNHILVWTYDRQVVSEIDSGYPTLFNMASSYTYGSHTVVVTGYRSYVKTTSFLGLAMNKYVDLMQLNDNWKDKARYFDYTAYVNKLSFGSFVRVR